MHPNWIQRRCCVIVTAAFLVFQAFYIVGRHHSGPVTAEAAAAAKPESESPPTRVQVVKQAYSVHKKNHSIESLEEGKKILLARAQESVDSKHVMDFVTSQLNKQTRKGSKTPPTPLTQKESPPNVYTLLIVIPSAPKRFDKRHLIRETWFKRYQNSSLVTVRFVVGMLNLSDEVKSGLLAEQEKFNDLVMIDDLLDSYKNLTRKTLYTFIWAAYNVNFLYLFKCDDDTYPQLERTLFELHERPSAHRLYWGFFLQNAPVRRTGKWRDREWSLGKHYVKFAIGGAYIISSDLIDLLVNNVLYLQLFTNEDVAVGLWLASYDIERKHDQRFCRFFHAQECTKDSMMALGVADDDFVFLYMDE